MEPEEPSTQIGESHHTLTVFRTEHTRISKLVPYVSLEVLVVQLERTTSRDLIHEEL